MSGIMMQLLGTAGGIAFADNFVAYYAKASTQVTPKGSYFDYGDDKIYIAGASASGSSNEGFVLELSNQGEILQQKIDDSVIQHTSVYVDSSNDIYVTSKGSGTTSIDVIKYNSSLVRQWGVKYTKQTGQSITTSKIFNIFNQSDYVGIGGIVRDDSNFKLDAMVGSIKKSDGTIGASNTTFKRYGSDAQNQQLVDVIVNTDENAIITGITDRITNGGTFTSCMKWDNTAKRWSILSSSQGLQGSAATYPISMVNDSKTIYVLGYHQNSPVGTVDAYMVKYNSNNNTISNPVFTKGYGVSGTSLFFWSCSEDGTYVYATAQNGTTNYVVAFKMSDGTIQWQNKITGGPYFDIGTHVDSNGSKLILVGRQSVNSHNQTVVMRVPKDGTGTGTYGSVTYASTSDISAYNLWPAFTVTNEGSYDSEGNFTTVNSSTSGTVANLGAKIESYN